MNTRRLIGPTILSIVFCGLLADYLYFTDSHWSVVGLLGKVVSIFGAIFAPALDRTNYGWINDIVVPVTIVGAAIFSLLVVVTRAKRAMREATPVPGAAIPTGAVPTAYVENKPTSALPSAEEPPRNKRRQYGLLGRLTVSFCAVGIFFGISAGIVVYGFLNRVMDKQVESRADDMAFGINEIATRNLAAGTIQDLANVITKYASIDGIAFIFIEDATGRIIGLRSAALDVSIRAQILNLLRDLQARLGLSYLFIAHDLAAVAHMSHEIVVMYLGKIVESGDARTLAHHALHPYTKALFSAALPSHPDERREEVVVSGEVPSPLNPPSGCHFHPRCPHAMPRCALEMPTLRRVEGRMVACHLYS